MNIPGDKFTLDLSDGEDAQNEAPYTPPPIMNFVGDIVEKSSTSAPQAPVLFPSSTGFPAHKKRIPKNPSRFRQRAAQTPKEPPVLTERAQISADNEARLASMSAAEIEEERRELLEKLSPGLIETLLRRAKLADESAPAAPALALAARVSRAPACRPRSLARMHLEDGAQAFRSL